MVAGCGRQIEPARQSLGDIQAVVISASADAATYVPDQLAAVQRQLGGLESDFDRKDYAAVLRGAPAVLDAARALAGAADAKKAQQKSEDGRLWTGLAAVLPDRVDAIQRRIDLLAARSGGRAGARGATAPDPNLDAARAALGAAESSWSKAPAAFATGNLEEAVATAKAVDAQLGALAGRLSLSLTPQDAPAAPGPTVGRASPR